jgi:hypothetical protein
LESEQVKELIVYECPHCKKLFRTKTRHSCKYDPDNKNCFTCKHNIKFDVDHNDCGYGQLVYVVCEKEYDADMPQMIKCKYKLDCQEYEFGGVFHKNEHHKAREEQFESDCIDFNF